MTHHTLQTPDGRLAITRHGTEGRHIIAVPGIGDTRESWRALAPLLARQGFVVHAMDLRGHGASDTGFPSYRPEDIGRDILALLRSEDLRDVILMGNSIGGAAVAHAALEAPDRVTGLVMVNPFVRDMPADAWMRPMVPLMFARPWGGWVWGQYRATLFKTRPADLAQNHAAVTANMTEPGRLEAIRAMMRATKAGIHARLDQLRVPTLVVMGAQDPDYADPAQEGHTVSQLLGGPTEVAVVADTGHYTQVERPEETARLVLDFLGRQVSHGA